MIAIIDGCGANVASLQFALQRLGTKFRLTADKKQISNASKVIIPGVSSAQNAIAGLEKNGLIEVISNLTQPVLGICSGMQVLFEWCQEGEVDALSLFPGRVEKLATNNALVLPHIGWNTLDILIQDCPLLRGITNHSYVYYVHSYAAKIGEYTMASTQYGNIFSALVAKDNFYGMQFHPERSGVVGSKLLENFIQGV